MLNFSHLQNTFRAMSSLVCDQIFGYCGLAKLTPHEINYHGNSLGFFILGGEVSPPVCMTWGVFSGVNPPSPVRAVVDMGLAYPSWGRFLPHALQPWSWPCRGGRPYRAVPLLSGTWGTKATCVCKLNKLLGEQSLTSWLASTLPPALCSGCPNTRVTPLAAIWSTIIRQQLPRYFVTRLLHVVFPSVQLHWKENQVPHPRKAALFSPPFLLRLPVFIIVNISLCSLGLVF